MPDILLDNEYKYTKYSTLALLVLKELRAIKTIPHAVIAEAIGKTPSAWSKIENGQAQLTVNAIYGACDRLSISPSDFFDLTDRAAQILSNDGWFISYQDNDQDDRLMPIILNFYRSKGYKSIKHQDFININELNRPYSYSVFNQPAVLLYLIDEKFKKAVDSDSEEIFHYPKRNIFGF